MNEAAEFIAEYYRRQDLRFPEWGAWTGRSLADVIREQEVIEHRHAYRAMLPADKASRILDIGFGNGWFIAAALSLGYADVEGADFGAESRKSLTEWGAKAIHNIDTDIAGFLADKRDRYDFIHMSHVIEHIPRTDLFRTVDALYAALRPGGTLLLRTPNMDGPKPVSSRYIVLTHETGFTGTSLSTLLQFCNFDDVIFHEPARTLTLRQRGVALVRGAFIAINRLQHRLFGGVSVGNQYGWELVVSARRIGRPPIAMHRPIP
jgi:SAM-dependent methyltransferase